MKNKKFNSVQEWLPFKRILDNGVIINKNNEYVKVINVIPINYNLKSNLEKEAILNSYKIFLKTCQFDIQILIQSNKEDLSQIISKIKEKNKNENNSKILKLSEDYIDYIKKLNQEKNSSSKNFYILIKYPMKNNEINEKIAIENLNDKYLKIKECLSRCGNYCEIIENISNIEKLFLNCFNKREVINYF